MLSLLQGAALFVEPTEPGKVLTEMGTKLQAEKCAATMWFSDSVDACSLALSVGVEEGISKFFRTTTSPESRRTAVLRLADLCLAVDALTATLLEQSNYPLTYVAVAANPLNRLSYLISMPSVLVCKVALSLCLREITNQDSRLIKEKVDAVFCSFTNSGNPSMRGFYLEEAVILCLMKFVLPRCGNLWGHETRVTSVLQFASDTQPPSNSGVHLLVPKQWNYADVDAILVVVDPQSITVVGVQITMQSAQAHAHSLQFVRTTKWRAFLPRNTGNRAVRCAFLWVSLHSELPESESGFQQYLVSTEYFEKHAGLPRVGLAAQFDAMAIDGGVPVEHRIPHRITAAVASSSGVASGANTSDGQITNTISTSPAAVHPAAVHPAAVPARIDYDLMTV